MGRKLLVVLGVMAMVWVLSNGGHSPCEAQEVKPADFYKGKTISLVVTDDPGGNVDGLARLIAPYLKQYTGATVMVTNMRGGGGLEGVVHVKRARPDGLTLGMGSSIPIILNKIMGEPGADYEPEKFAYIIGITKDPNLLCVASKGPYASIADLKAAKNIKFGGTSPAGNISLGGMTAIHILGLDAKLVAGSKGTAPLLLSIRQGELAGVVLPLGTAQVGISTGVVKPLCILRTKRDPVLPNVPAITELVQLKAEEKKMVEFWDHINLSRVLLSPPGVPQNRITFLSDIARKHMITDPAFREHVDRIVGYKNDAYLIGDEMDNEVKALMKDEKEIEKIFKGLIERYRA